jgi:hypothetical protein
VFAQAAPRFRLVRSLWHRIPQKRHLCIRMAAAVDSLHKTARGPCRRAGRWLRTPYYNCTRDKRQIGIGARERAVRVGDGRRDPASAQPGLPPTRHQVLVIWSVRSRPGPQAAGFLWPCLHENGAHPTGQADSGAAVRRPRGTRTAATATQRRRY